MGLTSRKPVFPDWESRETRKVNCEKPEKSSLAPRAPWGLVPLLPSVSELGGLGAEVSRLVMEASIQRARTWGPQAQASGSSGLGGALPEEEKPLRQLQPVKRLPSFFPF